MKKLRYVLVGLLISTSSQAADYRPRCNLFKTALVGISLMSMPNPILGTTTTCPESSTINHQETDMATQNSIYAPTPTAIAKGGTGNSAALTNGQLWVGNTGNVPTPATLTAGGGISITNAAGSITVTNTFNLPITSIGPGSTTIGPGVLNYVSAAGATLAMPTSPVPGDTYYVTSGVGAPSAGYTLSITAGQRIAYNNVLKTTSLSITAFLYPSISLVYVGTSGGFQIFSVIYTSPGSVFT